MSNYVWNKVVCRKDVLEQFLIDPEPFGDGRRMVPPYISFNKLFGVNSLNEYSELYGTHIYYGYGDSWDKRDDGLYEVKFATRWEYPIRAILRILELAHDTLWLAMEENHIYVSKFYWSGGVKEDILFIDEDDVYRWADEKLGADRCLKDCDDEVWYYLPIAKGMWRNWPSSDHFSRYLDVSAVHVKHPFSD